MQIGDWKVEDLVTYLYFAYAILYIFASIGVVFWMILLIRKEMKEVYIDLLLITQYSFILVWFLYTIYEILCNFWYEHTDILIIRITHEMLEYFILYYYILNLWTWYLLIHQIIILQQLRDKENYQKCRQQTRSTEIKLLKIFIWFICAYSIINLTLLLLSNYIQSLRISNLESIKKI